MDAASRLAGHPVAVATDASPFAPGGAVAARDARLDPKLVAAAHAFEASLMQELLKPLNRSGTFGADEDGNEEGDSGGGALMSFGSEALAAALSEKGGLGIARRILDHFEDHFETAANASEPNANQRERTTRAVKP